MKITIRKLGDSLGIRLPKKIVDKAGLSQGMIVDVRTQQGSVIISPWRRAPDLDELLARFQPEHRREETDWGAPTGEESC